MSRHKEIKPGQFFTPNHLAEFMAELLEVGPSDAVFDSSAGEGALLLASVNHGVTNIYGIDNDSEVCKKSMINILSATEGRITCDFRCMDARTEEAAEWIRSKPITAALLNPPYETTLGCYDILNNTLDNLTPRTRVALLFPSDHLEHMPPEVKDTFIRNNRIDKIIRLPIWTFKPLASMDTSLFLITAGIPQAGQKIWGCHIKKDGLYRNPGKYRIDKNGTCGNEFKLYWLKVIRSGMGDESVIEIDPAEHLSYWYEDSEEEEAGKDRTTNGYTGDCC